MGSYSRRQNIRCEVRHEGFVGDVKEIWKELDADGEGTVSLIEFAPKVASLEPRV